jgi:phosphomannomutase
VVHDVLASRFVDDAVRALGGQPVECRVGHTFISQRMAETRAVFAGELSGHYYFEETGYADDALFASLLLLRTVAGDDRPLSGRVEKMRNPYISRNFRVSIPEEEKEPFMRRLLERVSREYPTQTMDGVKVLLPGGWALIRPSNTEPKLSVAYEASDPAAFGAVEAWVNGALAPYLRSEDGRKKR